jgi:hypothetical protein
VYTLKISVIDIEYCLCIIYDHIYLHGSICLSSVSTLFVVSAS